MRTVFYSWQSDLHSSTNRGFIQICLEDALHELHAEGIQVFEPDRDIQGETGSPDIAETIFDKIDRCSAFIADVSFINGGKAEPIEEEQPKPPCDCTRLTPNPNVMGEWGRATKSVGFERIVSVLNTATGKIEDLPFDMRKRSVVTYHLVRGADKKEAKKTLVGKLKGALKEILAIPLALLDLQFADPKTQAALGRGLSFKNTSLTIDPSIIPTFGAPSKNSPFPNLSLSLSGLGESSPNENYYRDKADYLYLKNLAKLVMLVITNTGGRLLSNVRLRTTFDLRESGSLMVVEREKLPRVPRKRISRFSAADNIVRGVKPPFRTRPGELTVIRSNDQYKVEVSFGNIQARDTVLSDIFVVGACNQPVGINGLLFADELSEPILVILTLNFESSCRDLTLEDLKTDLPEELPRPKK